MSASELVEQANTPNAIAKESEAKRSFPKTHVNYWKARLEHRTYTREGKTHEVPERFVMIHFGGIRKSFDLESGNKEEAAYKLFLLCMCAGLRRGEADVCLWSQLRPEDC